MFDKMIVQEALKRSMTIDFKPTSKQNIAEVGQDSEISQLIYDIFGGEILKTHKKNGWHFYNRVEGERLDFTRSTSGKLIDDNRFEDLPSNSDETTNYFVPEDYSSFFMRFTRAFEEAVGLEKKLTATIY